MPAKPFPSDILAPNFRTLSGFDFLDAGTYKSVYRVVTEDGKLEVLKIVRLPQDESTEAARALRQQELGRAMRETSLLSKCTSPCVVKLGSLAPALHVLEGESCLAYSEEFLPGGDLKAVIAQRQKPADREVKALLSCLVKGVQSLWSELKAVHRDIKPANIFATGQEERPYVLLDLGIAYNVSEPGLTVKPDHIPATPLYMAPEMLDPNFRDALSYRADLYASGLTVFEFASGGTHPLARKDDDLAKTLTRVLHQEPLRLADLRPDLPKELCGLIDQLIKKNPALRPGNFALILNQLT
ncbi:MAG TPA: protein kinase [Chthoniobacterales bacterium]